LRSYALGGVLSGSVGVCLTVRAAVPRVAPAGEPCGEGTCLIVAEDVQASAPSRSTATRHGEGSEARRGGHFQGCQARKAPGGCV
jgi:hypothetical protein